MFLELILCVFTLLWILHIKKRRRLPKGPPSIPIFGSIDLFTKGNLLKAIFNEEYYTKYNDLCTFFLGPRKVLVVINDFKICKELFNKEEYSGKKLICYWILLSLSLKHMKFRKTKFLVESEC